MIICLPEDFLGLDFFFRKVSVFKYDDVEWGIEMISSRLWKMLKRVLSKKVAASFIVLNCFWSFCMEVQCSSIFNLKACNF